MPNSYLNAYVTEAIRLAGSAASFKQRSTSKIGHAGSDHTKLLHPDLYLHGSSQEADMREARHP